MSQDKYINVHPSTLPVPNSITPEMNHLLQNTPQNSFERGILKFNPATNKMDVSDHFSLLHSNISRNDANEILEMANIAISRSKNLEKRNSKKKGKGKFN